MNGVHSNSTPKTCECNLVWEKIFINVIKLRIFRLDHTELYGQALNPMTSILIRERRKDTDKQKRRPFEDRGRDWSLAATTRECLEPLKGGRSEK